MLAITPKKKILTGLIIYILVIGAYLGIAITLVQEWRQINIDNSPTVYITSTGVKYHQAYHYQGRNSSTSLFEAEEKGYTGCGVCNPPIAPRYTGKPEFYFYHWFLTSILLSLIYWIGLTILNQKK